MPVLCSEPLGCRTRGKSGVFCPGFVPGSESGRLQPAFMILAVDGPPLRGRAGPAGREGAHHRGPGAFSWGAHENKDTCLEARVPLGC